MGTRFTRVTVVGDRRQVDISLPADAPLVGQLPAVLRLLSVPPSPTPVRWRLATPELGTLRPDRSLDDQGVLDGTVLHLTEAETAPPPPFVDDIEREVAELVGRDAPSWAGPARRSAVGGLLALVVTGLTVLGVASPAPVSFLAPAIALLAAVGAALLLPGRGGLWAGLAGFPVVLALVYGIAVTRSDLAPTGAAPVTLVGASTTWVGFRLVLGVAMAVVAGAVGAARRVPGAVLGAAVVLVAGVAAFVLDRAGMPAVRIAGLALVLAVVVVALAGQAALGGAGLVDLMVADEAGRRAPRERVVRAVSRGLSMSTGMLWAAAVIGGLACLELVLGGTAPSGRVGQGVWVPPALGALGGVILALRSRMFTRSRHIAPLLAAGVTAGIGVALQLPAWLGLTGAGAAGTALGALAVLGVLVVAAGLGRLADVPAARVARLLDRLELLSVLALIPGLVLLFRVIPLVQAWWS